MSDSGEFFVTLGFVGDETSLHQKTCHQLEAVLGEHFSCRSAEPTDTSVDVLVVVGKELVVRSVKEALLAGFPPGRIVVVIEKMSELQEICLDDLGIVRVTADAKGCAGSSVVTHVRSALSHLADPPLARSRVEETFGQLEMQHSETFHGLAFKLRLTELKLSRLGDSGLDVSVISGRNQSYPYFGSCPETGTNLAIVHATEKGLSELDAKEHALFTQALVCQCGARYETGASFLRKFVETACSILGRNELYRPALLIFQRSVQTLEVLLTGDLDLWLINPKRLPPIGVTKGPGGALSGTKDSRLGKERRIKLTDGDHLLLLPSGWFLANTVNLREREKVLLEAAAGGNLPDFLSLEAPAGSGAGIVVIWHNEVDGRSKT